MPPTRRVASGTAGQAYAEHQPSPPQERSGPPTEQIRGLLAAGRVQDAAQLIDQAIAGWPLEPEPRYLQAVLALDRGRAADAVRAAAAAAYLDPGLAAVHILLGQAQRAVGEKEAAVRSWARARSLLHATDPAAPVALTEGEPAGRLLALLDRVADRSRSRHGEGRP